MGGMNSNSLIIVKLGSQIVIGDNQNLEQNLSNIVEQLALLKQQGHRVIIVSSGAIGYGKSKIIAKPPLSMPQKQAAAAIGQPVLMAVYDRLFSRFNITTAQVLLTSDDFSNRSRYLALKDTFDCLLSNTIIPIVNENDCVAIDEMLDENTAEPSFGDNDRLSAILAVNLQADLLILLTNVDGIYSSNPSKDPQAKIIPLVTDLTSLAEIDTKGTSALGRGGMYSKIVAARIAAIGGTPTVIANGTKPEIIKHIVSNTDFTGTLISAQESNLQARKNWIGFVSGYRGSLTLNDCARDVILAGRSSLLAIGINAVTGDFEAGQVVQVKDSSGREIARGICEFSSLDIKLLKGKNSEEISRLTDSSQRNLHEVIIHKDQLVTTGAYAF